MKKKVLFIIIPIVIVAILVTSLVLFIKSKDLSPFFDEWKTESDFAFKTVKSRDWVEYDSELICLDEALNSAGTIFEVFCYENGRVYFFYKKGGSEVNWCIASCKEDGSDLQVHYAAPENTLYTYYPLSRYSSEPRCQATHPSLESPYGGLYRDHTIYLRHSAGIIAYSIAENTVSSVDAIPESSYSFTIDDYAVINVFDKNGTLSKTLTLESIAEKNAYAKKLLTLSDEPMLDKDAAMLDELFIDVKEINGRYFMLCEVRDYFGNAYAVVFEYDPLSDGAEYVTYYKTGDTVWSHYNIIPVEE